ncbi:MAG: hypothetical protein A2516_10030 [Alphaproteobacteria bacterium RIFOXYD12_FULL_60_8]|nr:MAG: hypothetical protein A2516_10030 [Alphaproteobacteria bacterium RIFOXYD12_FULL_60_8]
MTVHPLVVRASSLTGYPDCPRRWAARHLAPEVKAQGYDLHHCPTSVGAVVGTATHAGATTLLTAKMRFGVATKGDQSEAVDRGETALHEEVAQTDCLWDATTASYPVAQSQVARQIRVYADKALPALNPIAVEERLDAAFSPEITLSGQVDLAEDSVVDDLKTGTTQRANHAQYGAYALLRRSHGFVIEHIKETFVQRVSLKKTQPDPVLTTHPVATCEQAALAVLKAIERDVLAFRGSKDPWAFLPNPGSTLCSPTYCPAHGAAWCLAHHH